MRVNIGCRASETVPIGGVGGCLGEPGAGVVTAVPWQEQGGGFVRRGGVVENKGGGCSLGGLQGTTRGGYCLGRAGVVKNKRGVFFGGACREQSRQ